MHLRIFVSAVALSLLIAPWARAEEPFVATLRLDEFSIVSFGDQEIYQLPPNGEIRFEFPSAAGGSELRFVVRPSDVVLRPMTLRYADESLQFTLSRTASGIMRRNADGGIVMEVDAWVVVTFHHPDEPGWKRIPLHLTTEQVTAHSAAGDQAIAVQGGRVSGRGVQLVGATTNDEGDYPGPGAPVYVVLSGAFDQLPALQ